MAQLTFPLQQNELRLTVVVSLNQPEMAKLVAAGQPLPAPIWTTGMIDTGSDISCIAADVVQKLGISLVAQTSTRTAGGPVPVRLFRVSLSIPPAGNIPGPMLTRSNLLVMELVDPPPDVEVFIGLDILLDCRLFLDGPGRQFTLDF
jgi:hypothetical protein